MEEKKEWGRPEGGGNRWLLTFNDMLTLLLTFFVMILSMSRMDAAKMGEASSAVGSAFGIWGVEEKTEMRVFDPFILSPGGFSPGDEKREAGEDEGYGLFLQKRDAFFDRIHRGGGMKAQATPQGMSVEIESSLLFPDGSAGINAGGRAALQPLCGLLKGTRPTVRVGVRTNERPSDRERFPTSWELAAARGAQVAQVLVSQGGIPPDKVSLSGYGAAQPAQGAEGKRGNPRREIEITLYFTKVEGR